MMIKRLWNNAVIKAIAAYLIFEIISFAIKFLCDAIGITFPASNLGELINEIVKITIPVLIVAFSFKTISTVKDPLKGFGKSFLCGLWFFLLCSAATADLIHTKISDGSKFKSAIELVFFALFIVAVVFTEELLHRGTITELLVRRYGDSRKGKLLTIFLGAALFSLCHITNLLRGQSLSNTLTQMISVFCFAVFVNTIYVKYRNLYVAILLHAALDIMTLSEFGLFENKALEANFTDKESSSLTSFIMCNSLYIIAAVIIFLVTNRKAGTKRCSKRSLNSSAS